MARISSAAYVTAVLRFLQAYNRGDLDACEALLEPEAEWHTAVAHKGRAAVRRLLESMRDGWTEPQARPDDFREADGQVLMVVCFYEGAAGVAGVEQHQAWIVTMSDTGLIRRVMAYTSAAEGARAFDALARRVHA